MIYKTCAFFGHRKIIKTDELVDNLRNLIENLIVNYNVGVFLFGSMSDFYSLCLAVVDELKEKYPHISRVFVRATYPHVEKWYEEYLLKSYDSTFYPIEIANSGRLAYVERNNVRVDRSDYCVFYYDENYYPPRRKESKKSLTSYQPNSGTRITYEYATRKKKVVFNIFPEHLQKI